MAKASSVDFNKLFEQFGYRPQYTGKIETDLYDVLGKMIGKAGAVGIPFDIGLPTTGLYDALTRGIKEEYLGEAGAPESGKVADLRAYYNNIGVPEQAINQERLAYKDLNNSLLDTAAKINESQKDRLFNVLNSGVSGLGSLYGQNLGTMSSNLAEATSASKFNAQLAEAVRQANNKSISDLLGGIGATAGTILGGPIGGVAAKGLSNLLGQTSQPLSVSRNASYSGGNYLSQPFNYNSAVSSKLI